MDYETKLYLDKLIEAVDSPDGWAIALTCINVIAIIVIAYVQICIQKKQKAMQMYEQFRSTLELLTSIEDLANSIIYNIAYGHARKKILAYGEDGVNFWRKTLETIEQLDNKFHNNSTHIKMQFFQIGLTDCHYMRYYLVIHAMFRLVDSIDRHSIGNKLSLNLPSEERFLKEGIPYLIKSIEDSLNSVDFNEESLKSFYEKFQLFLSCRNDMLNNNALSSIRAKCKID